MKKYPDCKCTFAQYMTGDGCDECAPDKETKMKHDYAGALEALLPCPFCGGEAKLKRSVFKENYYFGQCAGDDCVGWVVGSAKEATAAWNTRAALPAPPAAENGGDDE